jgi:hypothetical protein
MSDLPNTKGMGSIPQVEAVGDTHEIALTGAADVMQPQIDAEDLVRIERDDEDLFDLESPDTFRPSQRAAAVRQSGRSAALGPA